MPPPRDAKKLFRSAKVKLQCVAAFRYSRAYKAEGDPSLNTPEAKLTRERMFLHEDLQSRFRRFWSILDLAKDPVTNELTAASYTLLSTKVQRVMIKDFDAAEAEQDAQKDWKQDVTRWAHRGRRASQVGMAYEAFQKSMFELADVWTEEIDVAVYCRFLDEVLGAVVQDINAEQLRFKRDEDITFNRRLSRRSSSRSSLAGKDGASVTGSGSGLGTGSRLPLIGEGSELSAGTSALGLDVSQGSTCSHGQPSARNRRLSSQGTLREVSLQSISHVPIEAIEEESVSGSANVHQLEGAMHGDDEKNKAGAKCKADKKAKCEAAEKAKLEADEKAKREADGMAICGAIEKARRETQAKAKREANKEGTGSFSSVQVHTTERHKALPFERKGRHREKDWDVLAGAASPRSPARSPMLCATRDLATVSPRSPVYATRPLRKGRHREKDWDVLDGVASPRSPVLSPVRVTRHLATVSPRSPVYAIRPLATVRQHSGSTQSSEADSAATAAGSAQKARRVYVSSPTASERSLYMRAVKHAEETLKDLRSQAQLDSSTMVTRSRISLDATDQCSFAASLPTLPISPVASVRELQLCPVAADTAARIDEAEHDSDKRQKSKN